MIFIVKASCLKQMPFCIGYETGIFRFVALQSRLISTSTFMLPAKVVHRYEVEYLMIVLRNVEYNYKLYKSATPQKLNRYSSAGYIKTDSFNHAYPLKKSNDFFIDL